MPFHIAPTATRLYVGLGFSMVSFCIGIAPFSFGQFFSKLYGLQAATPSAIAYQQALGVRDVTLGLAYLLSYMGRDTRATETLLISHGFIGFGDALVVWLNGGNLSRIPVHLGGGLLATGIGLWFRLYYEVDVLNKKTK